MSTLDLFKKDYAIGDVVTIELISGRNVKGKIIELSNLVKIEDVDGKCISLLEPVIGGWELKERGLFQSYETREEDINDGISFCLQEYKNVIANSELTPRGLVRTNAEYLGPSDYCSIDYGIARMKSDGSHVFIRKQGFVGNPTVHLKASAGLFVMARPSTKDSVNTIGLMTFNGLNNYFDNAIKNRSYWEALTILYYLKDFVPELADQTEAISLIIEKVEYLNYIDGKSLKDSPLPWYWPFWLKDFIKEQIVHDGTLQTISDEELQSLFFTRFGISVSINQVEDIREEMGIPKEREDEGTRIVQEEIAYFFEEVRKQAIYDELTAIILAVVNSTRNELPTNAQLVNDGNDSKVKALKDDGIVLDVRASSFIGNQESLHSTGVRVYARPSTTSGVSDVTIQGMTFEELLALCRDRILEENYLHVFYVVSVLRSMPLFASKKEELQSLKAKLKVMKKKKTSAVK